MLRHQAALVTVAIAGFWPALEACPAELVALVPAETPGHPQSQSAPVQPPSHAIRPDVRSASLKIDRSAIASPRPSANLGRYRAATEPALSAPADGSRPWYERAVAAESSLDDLREAHSSQTGIELKLAPSSVMLKTGWNWSGRIGPVRWLGPLDIDSGETKLRLGRVEGQPRPAGLGKFNVSIHYTFE
jgi:hypothetical protein